MKQSFNISRLCEVFYEFVSTVLCVIIIGRKVEAGYDIGTVTHRWAVKH